MATKMSTVIYNCLACTVILYNPLWVRCRVSGDHWYAFLSGMYLEVGLLAIGDAYGQL
jgi:hypothetical protein